MRQIVALTTTAALSLSLAGCAVINSNSSTSVSGTKVSERALNHVVVGETTEEQLIDLLGAPTRTLEVEKGVLYVYEYTEHRSSSGSLFLVFDGHSSKRVSATTSVLVRDGVVRSVSSD
jgi:hypothetical protein